MVGKIVFCEKMYSAIVENRVKKTLVNPLNLGNGCAEKRLLRRPECSMPLPQPHPQ